MIIGEPDFIYLSEINKDKNNPKMIKKLILYKLLSESSTLGRKFSLMKITKLSIVLSEKMRVNNKGIFVKIEESMLTT